MNAPLSADSATFFIDGTLVPVLPTRKAKCHNFCGGWNGFSFYTDSKGAMYAIASR